jgi:hypothetical protein
LRNRWNEIKIRLFTTDVDNATLPVNVMRLNQRVAQIWSAYRISKEPPPPLKPNKAPLSGFMHSHKEKRSRSLDSLNMLYTYRQQRSFYEHISLSVMPRGKHVYESLSRK